LQFHAESFFLIAAEGNFFACFQHNLESAAGRNNFFNAFQIYHIASMAAEEVILRQLAVKIIDIFFGNMNPVKCLYNIPAGLSFNI